MKLLSPQVIVEDPRLGERRRRGRPSVGDAEAHFKLPSGDYDAAFQLAARDRVDINDVFRRAIKKLVEEELSSNK